MRKSSLILLILLFCAWRAPAIYDKPIPLIPDNDPRAEKDFVYISGSAFYLHGEPFPLKGINYYPAHNPWRLQWSNWDPQAQNNEIALLSNLGINCVRIFLDYDLFEKHRKMSGSDSLMLKQLDELLGILEIHNMRALITPFVWGRGTIENDRKHIRHIVERFKNDPRILGWDISNELDHYWIDQPANRPAQQEWAAAIFAEIKSLDSNHPVTAGDYGWYLGDRTDPYGSGISIDLSKMSVPLNSQDFICFHWYEHYYAFDTAIRELRKITRKPILVEEIGLPTGGKQENGVLWPLNADQVALYYIAWMDVAERRGIYLMPWCGFDYDPSTSPYGSESVQNYWGLYDLNYALKATGQIFRDYSMEGRYLMKNLYGLPAIKIEKKEIEHERK